MQSKNVFAIVHIIAGMGHLGLLTLEPNVHWEISHPIHIGTNAHSKWIESTSAQSTSRGGLKWTEVD